MELDWAHPEGGREEMTVLQLWDGHQKEQDQEEGLKQPGREQWLKSEIRQAGTAGTQQRKPPGTKEHGQPAWWRPYAPTGLKTDDDYDDYEKYTFIILLETLV